MAPHLPHVQTHFLSSPLDSLPFSPCLTPLHSTKLHPCRRPLSPPAPPSPAVLASVQPTPVVHSSLYARVRASWGLLIQRWKDSSVEFLPFVIITGCLLHNFLIHHGEAPLDDAAAVMKEQKIAVYDGEGNDSSQRIRDVLALHLIRAGANKLSISNWVSVTGPRYQPY